MIRTTESEVQRLYNQYGVKNDKQSIKTVLNRGNLNKKLNCDYSNVFGKMISNSYSSNSNRISLG